ncbi:MAG: hypothetical protein JNM63_15060 [Spirochaetia bacterium]|nr:hypothetical protein [Spirochaetia bacterium]
MTRQLFFGAALALLFTANSCAALKSSRPVAAASVPVQETPVQPAETDESDLLTHIQKTLPKLSRGLSRSEVEERLCLDYRFKGLILSEGTGTDFKYYYELGDYELVLSFDYQKTPAGTYLQGFLRRV